MKKKCLAILLGIVTCISTMAGCGQQPGDTQESREGRRTVAGMVEPLATIGEAVDIVMNEEVTYDSLNHFSYELFRESIQDPEGKNPVISPLSAYVAMAMAGAGAQGNTLQEFYDVMGPDFISVAGKALNYFPTQQEKLQILMADSVWVDRRMNVNNNWLSVMGQVFGGEIYQVEQLFSADAMEQINKWASYHTQGMIDPFLDEPLTPETYLALINALYFDGEWEKTFEADLTRDRDFTLDDGTTVKIPMMGKYTETFLYYEDETCYGVLQYYKGNDYAFMALLPKESGEIRNFASKLDEKQVQSLLENARAEKCNLLLPKIDLNFELEMNQALINLGFQDAFDNKTADFIGMGTPAGTDESLFIGRVLQKVAVKVDEEGTEAAVVTMVEMRVKSAMMVEDPVIDVYYNRPFVYSIIDTRTNVPLFMGIFEDPEEMN